MIRTHCDHCDHHIGRGGGDWIGLDLAQLDDDGEIIEPLPEYQHHFCSFDCLASWAMHRAFTQPPTEATT